MRGQDWRAFRRAQLKCDATACARSCLRDPTLTKSDKRPTKELPPAAVLPLSGRPGRGRNPAGVRHAQSNSSSSCGKSPEVKFILSRRCIVTMLATNSGTSRRFRRAVLDTSRAEGDIGWVAPHQVEV